MSSLHSTNTTADQRSDAEDTTRDRRTDEPRPGRKCRRGRRERPYYQLTSEEERQRREEREQRRLERREAAMLARGRVMAPYNTTQFLMGDMDTGDTRHLGDFYSAPSDEDEFLCKEFNKDYEQQQFNSLWMMNKEKLLNEYLAVSKKNEFLEEKLVHLEEEEDKIRAMRTEMNALRAQNVKLQRNNSTMKERIRKLSENVDSGSDSSSNNMTN